MNQLQPRQLSLAVRLNDEITFDNFLPADSNAAQLVGFLKDWSATEKAQEPFVFLGGNGGSGCSHLLQACCNESARLGKSVQYLPLLELLDFAPTQLLENMEHAELICIDNIEAVAGIAEWEEALFNFYNRVRDLGHKLLVSGNAAPAFLAISLADLVSRLSWGPVFQTSDLNDEQKMIVLGFRAKKRGMEMSDEVARFLVNRSERGMTSLIAMLEKLDQQSLEQQRLLTIPFVKQLFGL